MRSGALPDQAEPLGKGCGKNVNRAGSSACVEPKRKPFGHAPPHSTRSPSFPFGLRRPLDNGRGDVEERVGVAAVRARAGAEDRAARPAHADLDGVRGEGGWPREDSGNLLKRIKAGMDRGGGHTPKMLVPFRQELMKNE